MIRKRSLLMTLFLILTVIMGGSGWAQCTEQVPCPEVARLQIIGGGVPAVAADCAWSSAPFAWNGTHSSGDLYWCKADDTSVLGVLNGSDCPTTCGTVESDWFLVDADYDRFEVAVTSSEFVSSAGYLSFDVKFESGSTPDNDIFLFSATTDIFKIYVTATRAIVFMMTDAGVTTYVTSPNSVITCDGATVNHVYVAWASAGNLHSQDNQACTDVDTPYGCCTGLDTGDSTVECKVQIGVCVGDSCGSPPTNWAYDVDADTYDTFGTEITTFRVGSTAARHFYDMYVTNIQLYTTTTPP